MSNSQCQDLYIYRDLQVNEDLSSPELIINISVPRLTIYILYPKSTTKLN